MNREAKMLELIDVSKIYRDGKRAVDGVTLRLEPGLTGLLGPNGAGKSSLMRVAATVTRPTVGRVLFEGVDVVAKPRVLRRRLGYLPQDFGVYRNLTAREFLSYLAASKGLSPRSAGPRIDEVMEIVNLQDARRRPLGKYSGGMLQRVGIAQTLLTDPKVLIVDEPTAGLDPEERVRIRNLLSDLATDTVVVLSTHIVSDLESVASDIVVMAEGRLLGRGAASELLTAAEGQVWEMLVDPDDVALIQQRYLVSRLVRLERGVHIRLLSPVAPTPEATLVSPDLEDAYLSLISGGRSSAAGR
jgi:ABC-2 type transport system ATP-binding protein